MDISRLAPSIKPQTFAIACGIFSGLTYGIYWIPLRAMSGAGFEGMWSVVLFNAVSFVFVLPLMVRNWRELVPGRARFHVNSFLAGAAFVVYAGAFLYTDVIRVIVLFYTLPIWGFLLARIFIGDRITPIRWVCMALGIGGLLVICGVDQGFPLPSNLGDWMALVAAVMWAGVALSVLTDRQDPVNYTVGFLFYSTLSAIVVAVIATGSGVLPQAEWSGVGGILLWLVPFALLVIVPAAFATLYAPSRLNPGIVGLLFMTEISVGTATAALFAGEPFGLKEIVGVILISLAGISEPIYQRFSQKSQPVP